MAWRSVPWARVGLAATIPMIRKCSALRCGGGYFPILSGLPPGSTKTPKCRTPCWGLGSDLRKWAPSPPNHSQAMPNHDCFAFWKTVRSSTAWDLTMMALPPRRRVWRRVLTGGGSSASISARTRKARVPSMTTSKASRRSVRWPIIWSSMCRLPIHPVYVRSKARRRYVICFRPRARPSQTWRGETSRRYC